jgi:hypothetical protein
LQWCLYLGCGRWSVVLRLRLRLWLLVLVLVLVLVLRGWVGGVLWLVLRLMLVRMLVLVLVLRLGLRLGLRLKRNLILHRKGMLRGEVRDERQIGSRRGRDAVAGINIISAVVGVVGIIIMVKALLALVLLVLLVLLWGRRRLGGLICRKSQGGVRRV